MLNQKYRATRPNIEETIKTGTSIVGKVLNTKISKDEGEKPGFAIVISKKIEKTSVGRHQIKRKISAYLEENLSNLKPQFKKTIVIFLKKKIGPLDYTEVKKDVEFVLKKVAF